MRAKANWAGYGGSRGCSRCDEAGYEGAGGREQRRWRRAGGGKGVSLEGGSFAMGWRWAIDG